MRANTCVQGHLCYRVSHPAAKEKSYLKQKNMNIKNVTVAGSGVLGFQIAFQTAFRGFKVSVYDINDDLLEKAKSKFQHLAERYKYEVDATQSLLDRTLANLSYSADLATAVKDADLLIEAIPENPQIKIDFYEKLAKVAPEKTVFTTNSSTLLPSQFAQATHRPEKFLALHFANEIWVHNIAEIMGHPGTSKDVFDTVVNFARSIGMIALPLYKEQPGYILNSLLVPFLVAGISLLANEVADYKTIDKAWMVATGAPMGPFGYLDIIGLTTAYNVSEMQAHRNSDPALLKGAQSLKVNFIDKKKLGVSTGEGFYGYPDPEYSRHEFLQ